MTKLTPVALFCAILGLPAASLCAQQTGGMQGGGMGGGTGGGGGTGAGSMTTGSQYGFGSVMANGTPPISRTTNFGQVTIFGERMLGDTSSGANRSFGGQASGTGSGGLGAFGGSSSLGNFSSGANSMSRGGMGAMGMGNMSAMGGLTSGLGSLGGMGGMRGGMGGLTGGLGGGLGMNNLGGGLSGGLGGNLGRNQFGQMGNRGQFGQNRSQYAAPARPRVTVGFSPELAAENAITTGISQRMTQLSSRQGRAIQIQTRGPVQVSLQGRTAILRGVVATEHDRAVAARVALLEPGVSQVQNELLVSAATTSAGPSPGSVAPGQSQ